MKKVTLDLYEVEEEEGVRTLDSTLRALQALQIQQRERVCGAVTIRLDSVSPGTIAGGIQYWFLQFTRARDNWPATGAANRAAEDLNLGPGRVLLEETFALYVPSVRRMVVQYNHFGVRAHKFADFFCQSGGLGPQGYSLVRVGNRSILEQYRRINEVAKMHIFIDNLSDADIARFKGTGLHKMMKASVEGRTRRLELTLSVEARMKDQSLAGRLVGPISSRIRKRRNPNDSLVLEARADESDRLHEIDLLAATEYRQYRESELTRTGGRRYTAESVRRLLERAWVEWNPN
ncbi:hypothetical protein P3W70_30385 [Achromobacter denitrificans]|uniref:DUF6731 family protein n=1 Tax=Achromobacter denitrificans TaxID=32002 RepID=UPI0023E77DFF|nr:DUF6731 family protein [Achromobacter denitrificans]MDF3862702.1 hypothetical protein [Achromobacter denitrificans]